MFNETITEDKPEEAQTVEVVINDEGLAGEEGPVEPVIEDPSIDDDAATSYVDREEATNEEDTAAVDEPVEDAVVENIEDPEAVEGENPVEDQYPPLLGYDKDQENPARLAEEVSYGENTQDEIA